MKVTSEKGILSLGAPPFAMSTDEVPGKVALLAFSDGVRTLIVLEPAEAESIGCALIQGALVAARTAPVASPVLVPRA